MPTDWDQWEQRHCHWWTMYEVHGLMPSTLHIADSRVTFFVVSKQWCVYPIHEYIIVVNIEKDSSLRLIHGCHYQITHIISYYNIHCFEDGSLWRYHHLVRFDLLPVRWRDQSAQSAISHIFIYVYIYMFLYLYPFQEWNHSKLFFNSCTSPVFNIFHSLSTNSYLYRIIRNVYRFPDMLSAESDNLPYKRYM